MAYSYWTNVGVAVQSAIGLAKAFTSITAANPGVASFAADPALADGDYAVFKSVTGMYQIENRIARISAGSGSGPYLRTLESVDCSAYSAATGAGVDQFGGILNTVRRRGVRSGRARALKRIRMTRQMKKLIAEAAGFLRSGAEQIGGESGRSLAKRGMNPYYFRFLEFWTKHIGKRAFLEPALVHGGAQGLDVMREVLVRSLDQVAREARA